MIPNMPTIGLRFDIKKVNCHNYGATCFTIFWEAIGTEELQSVSLYAGLSGIDVFCIAVQCIDSSSINKVRNAVSKSEAFRKVCDFPMFAEDSECISQPLPVVGKIDATGNLMADYCDVRSSYMEVEKRRQLSVPTKESCDAPKRQIPASSLTKKMPRFTKFSHVVSYIDRIFMAKDCEMDYWLTPEELCDIVEATIKVAQVRYMVYSCGQSIDMCCVSLSPKPPAEGEYFEFFGLCPFASEADARNFYVEKYKYHSGATPKYKQIVFELAGILGRNQINFCGEKRESGFSGQGNDISPSDLWPRLWARKQRFFEEAEMTRRKVEDKEKQVLAAEQKYQQEADVYRKAEDKRRAIVQAARKSSGECTLCGQKLTFIQKLFGKDRHAGCTSFKE